MSTPPAVMLVEATQGLAQVPRGRPIVQQRGSVDKVLVKPSWISSFINTSLALALWWPFCMNND